MSSSSSQLSGSTSVWSRCTPATEAAISSAADPLGNADRVEAQLAGSLDARAAVNEAAGAQLDFATEFVHAETGTERGTVLEQNPAAGEPIPDDEPVVFTVATVKTISGTLILRDTARNLEAIRGLVQRLDIPVRQVMIESRVVIASNDFARDLGVRFGFTASGGRDGHNQILVGGGVDGYLSGTAALDKGWSLYGSPTYAFDAASRTMRCGQAVVKDVAGKDYAPDMKLGEQ